jgi:hypothetical protein|tara:strand:+ start:945 stop:1229 length:285 start_codon:yes stop_codon:yes gene_type:complete
MITMRLHFKFLLLLIPIALAWTQYVTAEHEWVDHSGIEDCVICKIVENGSDKASLVDVSYTKQFIADSINTYFSKVSFYSKLWDIPLSRAPPVS